MTLSREHIATPSETYLHPAIAIMELVPGNLGSPNPV
jgi:hypothetical protein